MPKPVYSVRERRMRLLRLLDIELQKLTKRHRDYTPTGIPVGGGEWMNSFFKMEAIEGTQRPLREGANLRDAVNAGKLRSQEAIKKWNSRREWQVHRNEDTASDWLERLVNRFAKKLAN